LTLFAWVREVRGMGMMRRPACRSAALVLALAAMLFRGLLPAGWMPGASAGTPLVICTLSGPAHVHADANGKPAKHDNSRSDVCPFGAAPHFAALDAPIAAPVPAIRATGVALPLRFEPRFGRSAFSSHAPRAPPALA
jgi:hypothetical protein